MEGETLDFFEQWEKKHQEWEEQYAEIDSLLEKLRQSLNGDIEKWEHDAPTRSLHWTITDGLECSISMLLGSNLEIWGTAWKDEEEKSERWLRKESIREIIGPPFSQERLGPLLNEIAETLNKTTKMDLDWGHPVKLIPRP